jgi:ATP-binding cassette subfamily B multidrug efflux pump
MFTSGVLAIFEDVFVLAFIVIIMLRMSWPLALLTLSVIPAILYATKHLPQDVRDSYRRQRAATARINSFTQEYVSGMSVVQLFNRERRAFNDFSAVNARTSSLDRRHLRLRLYYPVVEFLSSTAIALVIWRGGRASCTLPPSSAHVAHVRAFSIFGTVTIGVLIAFIQYAQRFFRPIQDLSDKYNILQAAMAASERVFKLLDTEPEIVSPATPVARRRLRPHRVPQRLVHLPASSTRRSSARRAPRSRSEDLRTRFADIEWILRGVSFTIEPDETAAIVGHTGAGKTTITA